MMANSSSNSNNNIGGRNRSSILDINDTAVRSTPAVTDQELVSLLKKNGGNNSKRIKSTRGANERREHAERVAESSIGGSCFESSEEQVVNAKDSASGISNKQSRIRTMVKEEMKLPLEDANNNGKTTNKQSQAQKKAQKPRRRVATMAQRRAANIRERRRMFNLNAAFDKLRKKVPSFAYEKRLSRIETLKLAIMYIRFMDDLVRDDEYAEKYKQLTSTTHLSSSSTQLATVSAGASSFLSSGAYLSLYGHNGGGDGGGMLANGNGIINGPHGGDNHSSPCPSKPIVQQSSSSSSFQPAGPQTEAKLNAAPPSGHQHHHQFKCCRDTQCPLDCQQEQQYRGSGLPATSPPFDSLTCCPPSPNSSSSTTTTTTSTTPTRHSFSSTPTNNDLIPSNSTSPTTSTPTSSVEGPTILLSMQQQRTSQATAMAPENPPPVYYPSNQIYHQRQTYGPPSNQRQLAAPDRSRIYNPTSFEIGNQSQIQMYYENHHHHHPTEMGGSTRKSPLESYNHSTTNQSLDVPSSSAPLHHHHRQHHNQNHIQDQISHPNHNLEQLASGANHRSYNGNQQHSDHHHHQQISYSLHSLEAI